MKSAITEVLVLILQLILLTTCQQQSSSFDGCDNIIPVEKEAFLQSPYYPENYPANSACRYQIVAPLDHYIEAYCDITLPDNSQTEFFYIAYDGDVQLTNAEVITHTASIARTSLFRALTLAYISYGNSGKFHCRFFAKRQACNCGWSASARISNGQNAGPLEFPSMVALMDKRVNSHQFCGASIISHRYMLSAAHCFTWDISANFIRAIVGIIDLSGKIKSRYAAEHDIEQIIIHPYYSEKVVVNDIALLRTTHDIEWSRGVGPICLPPLSKVNDDFTYGIVDVIGWGSIFHGGPTSALLQKIQLLVIDNAQCQSIYSGNLHIQDSHICTTDHMQKSRDSCSYDSGGPVILRKSRMFLVGCISLGYGCGGHGTTTGVNTRITSHLKWILENIQYTNCPVDMP